MRQVVPGTTPVRRSISALASLVAATTSSRGPDQRANFLCLRNIARQDDTWLCGDTLSGGRARVTRRVAGRFASGDEVAHDGSVRQVVVVQVQVRSGGEL